MEDSGNGNKSQAVEKIGEAMVPTQKEQPKENSSMSIPGRPNINEINIRNEAIVNQERKLFYKVSGITVLLIIAIIFLSYFFS